MKTWSVRFVFPFRNSDLQDDPAILKHLNGL
jgi:hypothetical protein